MLGSPEVLKSGIYDAYSSAEGVTEPDNEKARVVIDQKVDKFAAEAKLLPDKPYRYLNTEFVLNSALGPVLNVLIIYYQDPTHIPP